MKQRGKELTVIWEEVTTPDAPQRLAAAFSMLLGARTAVDVRPDQSLDSSD